jgi:vacuolar protein sorting-associated protein 13A/C
MRLLLLYLKGNSHNASNSANLIAEAFDLYSLTSQDSPVMIIDAGHINIDSQLADKEVVDDIKNKDVQKYNKQDNKTLENLMYDKFNLQLSQTKVLIGINTKECLWQLQDNPPRNGVDARFIERIDMNFLIEMCILPGKTEFTKFKISGHLPLLSINLSDSKYKILMKIVDFIVPKSDDDNEEQATASRRPILDITAKSTGDVASSNVISERFWGSSQNNEIILPDSASEATALTSRSTSPISFAPSASIATSEIEQFKLTFQVDKVSASINETSATDATKETLLCEILLENFELVVLTRPTDLLVDVSLKALMVVDKMEHEGDFHHLITSNIIDRKETIGRRNEGNLVNVKYRKASRDHPQFLDLYDGYDQTVDVVLSTLTVVVTRKSLLRIYNWIMNTFTSPSAVPSADACDEEVYEGDVFYDDRSSLSHKSTSDAHSLQRLKRTVTSKSAAETAGSKTNDNRMKVAIHLDSVNLILNNDGVRLGTAELSYGNMNILLGPNTIEVNGRFGNFTLSDDTDIASKSNDASTSTLDPASVASETYLVTIVGDELADFTYKTYDAKASNFPGYKQKFALKMGAIQLFVTDSVKVTLNFLQEFLQMKNVYDAARSAAVETAQQYQQDTSSRFHFDIEIKSPVLILPIGANKKTDRLIAHLGEIRANNSFVKASRRNLKNIPETVNIPVGHINCGFYDISLRSIAVTNDESTGQPAEQNLPIIDDLDIVFDIESPEDPNEAVGPRTQIEGNISDVRMAVTERQYKSLLEAWDFIQKNFLAAAPAADENNNDANQSEETAFAGNHALVTSSSQSHLSPAGTAKPSTSTELVSKNSQQMDPMINLDLIFKLNYVGLEIMSGEDVDEANRDAHVLSKLAFDGVCMKLQNMSDKSMLMEVAMQSISFADTRVESKSQFKEILPANTLDGPQFQFRLHSFKDGLTPIMNMNVTVDSPKIVLSLDYLFLLKNFFMAPFIVIEPTEAQKFAQSHGKNADKRESDFKQVQQQNQQPATVMKYNVNVVDLQVLCLAAPENAASEAVILSFSQLTVIQETALQVHLDGIGMVLCRMDNREESTMHFVEEFSVMLKMETASTSSVHNLTSIKLDVEPIILRLSYQDALLITNIANKGIALMDSANKNEAPKPSTSDVTSDISSEMVLLNDDSTTQLSPVSPGGQSHSEKPKGIEPFIVMSKESVRLNVYLICERY